MNQATTFALITALAALFVLVIGPLLFGLSGYRSSRQSLVGAVPEPAVPWNWKLTIASALLYAIAFNLTFFIQELFLVLPKALTPGLRPVLFHNSHSWSGDNPLAGLFQGTGALAILVTGLVFAQLLRHRPVRSLSLRLFLIWMVYNGFMQSLPQVVIGSVEPANDVGMAMDYLHLGRAAKLTAALLAMIAIPVAALWLGAPLLSLAESSDKIATRRARTIFIFRTATVPALASILLIIPFRVPRNWVEVVAVPVVVTVIGIAWIQAGAWSVMGVRAGGFFSSKSIAYAFGGLVILLLIFQFVLRPGVRFN